MLTQTKDSLFNEYQQLGKDLQGISPKLSTYVKIKSRMNEIARLLGDSGMCIL